MVKKFCLLICVLFWITTSVSAQRVFLYDGTANNFYLRYTGQVNQLPSKAVKPYMYDFKLLQQEPDNKTYMGYIDLPGGVGLSITEKDSKVLCVYVSIYKDQLNNTRSSNSFKAAIVNSLIVCGIDQIDAVMLCLNMNMTNGNQAVFTRKSYTHTQNYDRNIGYYVNDDGLFINLFLSAFDDDH